MLMRVQVNQWSRVEWDDLPFEKLSWYKKRQLLFKEAGCRCTECGFEKRRPCGGLILEIDHIDGNSNNDIKENLRVLCPNCHALTPNFRNWGRSGKTSNRIRKGNIDFSSSRQEARQKVIDEERAYKEHFCQLVNDARLSKTIEFEKYGWVQKLATLTNETHHMARRKLERWMPDFYWNACFRKHVPKRKAVDVSQ